MENYKIEKEYKMILTEMEFNQIKDNFCFDNIFIQTNYYYDSSNPLYLRGISIRIREISNEFIFTLKKSVPNGNMEYEFQVENNYIDNNKIKDLLSKLEIFDELFLVGSLKTIRYTYKDKYGELCLDKNTYNGLTDYEIEYELFNSKNDKLEHFREILNKFNIKYIENTLSKQKRFRDSLL